MDNFSPLKNSTDLRDKLRRDLAKIESALLDTDAYFNFFVTAEQMLDWIFPGKAGKKQRTTLRKSEVLLQVCSHLANNLKHFRVEDPQHDSIRNTRKESGNPGARVGVSQFGSTRFSEPSVPPRLYVDLKKVAAAKLGKSIEAIDLARRVMAYWDGYPLEKVDPPSH